MPASPQSSGTAGSIVLVEEYGALAVAIGSALKKFAPGFATRTVRSLEEAVVAAGDTPPDLLVIDFDPPHAGALDSFLRLKSSAPAARVVFIAAAPLAESRGGAPGALEFVEKPFDLAALGNAVQAVLGTRNGAASRRTLRDLALRDVVPLQCLGRVTGVLKVDASEGRTGEVHFTEGNISHAETSDTDGIPALQQMLQWRFPRFKQPKRRPRAARTIEGKWATVLAEAFANADAGLAEPSGAAEEREIERVGGGKKVVVIDDTDMLLLFVEDSLTSADPTLEITTACNGQRGVETVAAMKPDLVLLDYSLPDFNGDEVCRRLADDANTASIPIIMMSGHVPEMAAAALRYGNIVATVAKPFRSEALLDVVSKAFANPAQFSVRQTAAPAQPTAVSDPPPTPPKAEPEHRTNGQHTAPAAQPTAVEPPAEQPKSTPSDAPMAAKSAAPQPPNPPSTPRPPRPPTTAVAAPAVPTPAPVTYTTVAPPPPIPVMAPAPMPVLRRAVVEPLPQRKAIATAPMPQPLPLLVAPGVAPARIATAATNAVILGLALEVLAIQFSPTLQMAAIRARPASRTISLHVHPDAVSTINLPEAGFELGPVTLDARGQIDAIRLLPTAQRLGAIPPRKAFPVGALSVLPATGGKAVELTPAAVAPVMMLLSAPFDLTGVELSPAFRVDSLVLKARPGEIRVSLDRDGAQSGAAFKTAQVLLNRSAEIAEILLDAVV